MTLLAFDTESSGAEQGRTWLLGEITAPDACAPDASETDACETDACDTTASDPGGDRPAA